MDSRSFSRAACIGACGLTLLAAGCDANWPDRLPEVAQANAQAGPEQPAAASAGTVNAPAPESSADAKLSSQVESALKAEPDLHGVSIAVRSDGGVVTLSGTAKDLQRRSMAAEVALSIEGVKLVRNEITLAQEA